MARLATSVGFCQRDFQIWATRWCKSLTMCSRLQHVFSRWKNALRRITRRAAQLSKVATSRLPHIRLVMAREYIQRYESSQFKSATIRIPRTGALQDLLGFQYLSTAAMTRSSSEFHAITQFDYHENPPGSGGFSWLSESIKFTFRRPGRLPVLAEAAGLPRFGGWRSGPGPGR